jgi:predicted DsbA family dithiol-disulfide isomerase
VLLKLAEELGLDANRLHNALENRDFETSVLADEHDAERLGVSGVPAIVADRRVALSGVQSLTRLQELVNRARAMSTEREVQSSEEVRG